METLRVLANSILPVAMVAIAGAFYDAGRATQDPWVPNCTGQLGTRLEKDVAGNVRQVKRVLQFSERIRTIPEYHDCQRFLVPTRAGAGAALGYSQYPFEIFAHDTLARVGSAAEANPKTFFAVAEIESFGQSYAPLGITAGRNCLYLSLDQPTPHAEMLHDERCSPSVPLERTNMRPKLWVTRTSYADFAATDIPPVARWGWDPDNKVQYIGIACGAQWCTIFPEQASLPKAFNPGHPMTAPGEARSPHARRVWSIPGWADYQVLATQSGANHLHPGTVTAAIIPDPDLGTLPHDSFPGHWVHVATVLSTGAYPKLALGASWDPEKPAAMVAFCQGTPRVHGRTLAHAGDSPTCEMDATPPACASDDGQWWAQFTSNTGETVYTCMHQEQHPGVLVPATVRWRWTDQDEHMWGRCGGACCQSYGI